MFDKRLIKGIKTIKSYFIIGTAAAIVAVSLTIYQGLIISKLIDDVFLKGLLSSKGMLNSLILLCLIIALKSLVGFLLEYYNRLFGIRVKNEFRRRLIDSFIEMGPIRLRNEKSGRLSSLSEEGIEAFDPYYSEFIPQMIFSVISIPMILFVVIKRDLISGVIMLLTAPLIPVFMMLIGKLADYHNKNQWKSLQRMSGHLLDVLRGLSTLKLFGKTKSQKEVIWRVSEGFKESTMGVLRISFLSALVLELIATLSTAILAVALGFRLLYGKMEFYDAFFILLMAPEYYMPLRQLGAKFHAAMGARAAADSIFPILEKNNKQASDIKNENIKFENIAIDIEGLCFSYDSSKMALGGINLRIAANERLALVGQSGGGKSTLSAVIMGFLKDYDGKISINGTDLRSLDRGAWSENYAYVPQQPRLFKGTIMENLRISRPSATEEEVISAAREIGIDAFVAKLPMGYETLVGEGGITLSGGQIQLIAIGRAFLKNTPLIILDEPTSALDVETERILDSALESVFKNKTVITIAHRIPTIISSDTIYVLENGEIVEEGNHEELSKAHGVYGRLLTVWEGQL